MTGPEDKVRLRLVSYNIRKAVGLDWRRDPLRTLHVIAGLSPDIVALQEADKRLGPRPAALAREAIERETDLRPVLLARSAVSVGWHGNAILVRKTMEVREVGHIELPGIEPRGAVMARVCTAAGELTVVGVHLGLRRRCRRLQFHRILGALSGGDARAVLLGDFNEWSETRGTEALLPHFHVISPGPSFPAGRPMAPLDRMALGARLELVAAGVENGPLARRASDHLPIWAEVALRR